MHRLILAAALLLAGTAHAADLSITVKTTAGAPVKDAVVMFTPAGGASTAGAKFDQPLRMAQKNIAFDPFVLITPVGSDVNFPNFDAVRHHVYSFSPAKKFELKLYGKDESRSVHFDKAGVVAVGCNIHDQMSGFIRVVDTPFAARTNEAGLAVVHGAPAGSGILKVWQPYLKAPGNEVARPVQVGATGLKDSFSLEFRGAAGAHAM